MDTAALREMPSSLNDACRKLEQAADHIDKLTAALMTTHHYIGGTMIAHAVVVPPGAQPPFDGYPSLMQIINVALGFVPEQCGTSEGK